MVLYYVKYCLMDFKFKMDVDFMENYLKLGIYGFGLIFMNSWINNVIGFVRYREEYLILNMLMIKIIWKILCWIIVLVLRLFFVFI